MADFSAKFYANFIKDDRWLGLGSGSQGDNYCHLRGLCF